MDYGKKFHNLSVITQNKRMREGDLVKKALPLSDVMKPISDKLSSTVVISGQISIDSVSYFYLRNKI